MKYDIFLDLVTEKSFTRVAKKHGYSQSAVSQMVHSLEKELGTTLLIRGKEGISLTADGKVFLPYIQNVACSLQALEQKKLELHGLENTTIRIGTFASVSRNWLPGWIRSFKKRYPKVNFVLMQGEYSNISQWIKEGTIDFGFVNATMVSDLEVKPIYEDSMVAVLPVDHPLADKKKVSLAELADEDYIELDEGAHSVALEAFQAHGLCPNVQYKVYDDSSIIEMIRNGLGISILYELILKDEEKDLAICSIEEPLRRTVALAWVRWDTMSSAARKFVEFILAEFDGLYYN